MSQQITIKIDYEGLISLTEVSMIIADIDYEIESFLLEKLGKRRDDNDERVSENKYVQIKSLSEGSVVITGLYIVGGVVGGLVGGQLKEGFEQSELGKRIQKLGKIMGDETNKLINRIGKSLSSLIKKISPKKRRIQKVDVFIEDKSETGEKEITGDDMKTGKRIKRINTKIKKKAQKKK